MREAKIRIRKICSSGDECVAVRQKELGSHLHGELERGYSVAIKTEERDARFVGKDLQPVLEQIESEVKKGAKSIDVLLIPPVAGG